MAARGRRRRAPRPRASASARRRWPPRSAAACSATPQPEVGWITVESNDAEHVPSGPWLAWHEDGFTLPPLAYELARNAFGVQAFCHCRHLAVQFHPEVTPAIVDAWAVNDHGDLERAGITQQQLDDGTARHGERAAQAAATLFDGFAARAGLVAVASRV